MKQSQTPKERALSIKAFVVLFFGFILVTVLIVATKNSIFEFGILILAVFGLAVWSKLFDRMRAHIRERENGILSNQSVDRPPT